MTAHNKLRLESEKGDHSVSKKRKTASLELSERMKRFFTAFQRYLTRPDPSPTTGTTAH